MANHLFDKLLSGAAGSAAPFLHLPDGTVISYGEFHDATGRYAAALSSLGLKPGDRLALQLEKSPHALTLIFACIRAGVVFLPLNTAYTADEVGYFVSDSGASVVLGDGSKIDALAEKIGGDGIRFLSLNPDGSGSFADTVGRAPSEFETIARGPDDLAAFLYTSGTTGRSKGAMLTQNNLLSNALTLADLWRFTKDDVLLHALPIFHTHGLFVATNVMLSVGGSMIFLPKFDLDQMIDMMPKATSMMGVPTFYTRLLGDPRFTKELTAHMRLFVSGSAPLLAEVHTQFEAATGHRILERYGMTETNMNTSNPYDGERKAGTVGFPLPDVSLRIVNPETGAAVPDGDVGEIEVKGPNVFKGYWNMPEKTKEEFRPDGYFRTGDLGQIGSDGYVRIVGRSKDLIISGGYNIYPKEIELLLDDQPGVKESAVVGVPHADFGEGVVAVLVPDGGAGPDTAAIEKSIAGSLARFKQPKAYFTLDELPRNTMGKVQKNMLRDRFKDTFA